MNDLEPPAPTPDDSGGELRSRAAHALDGLAVLRWRMGGIAALVFVSVLVFVVSRQGSTVPTPDEVASVRPASTTTLPPASAPPAEIVVDVGGAVQRPGVYRLSLGDRVVDAVDRAGGLTGDADTDRLNLAGRVSDGERVYVLRKGQVPPVAPFVAPAQSAVSGGAPAKVDINNATVAELETLPGVGPAIAQAIVDHRSQHGSFASVDDLGAVKGIGPAKLGQIKPRAKV